MTSIVRDVLDLVSGDARVARGTIEALVGADRSAAEVSSLHDVVEGTRRSTPSICGPQSRIGDRVTVVHATSARGVAADLHIATCQEGRRLEGLRVTPEPVEIAGPDDLRTVIRSLGAVPAVCLATDGVRDDDGQVLAVASLMKIFVLRAVLTGVDTGRLHLEQAHALRTEDLSPRSAGLGPRHVGATLTIRELCRLMVLRSDNTATDVLMALVGDDAVRHAQVTAGVPPAAAGRMADTRSTWTWSGSADHTADPQAELSVVHGQGRDYFVALAPVVTAMELIAEYPQNPWPGAAGLGGELRYKGGSAPGVLCGLWHRVVGREHATLAMSVNSDHPLGMLEEIHILTCTEQLLPLLERRHGAPTGGAARSQG